MKCNILPHASITRARTSVFCKHLNVFSSNCNNWLQSQNLNVLFMRLCSLLLWIFVLHVWYFLFSHYSYSTRIVSWHWNPGPKWPHSVLHKPTYTERRKVRKDWKTRHGKTLMGSCIYTAYINVCVCVHVTVCACMHACLSLEWFPTATGIFFFLHIASRCLISSLTWDHKGNIVSQASTFSGISFLHAFFFFSSRCRSPSGHLTYMLSAAADTEPVYD